jgi:hypothetical protein
MSKDPCTIDQTDNTISIQTTKPMKATQGATFVMKFAPDSFAMPPKSFIFYAPIILSVIIGLSLAYTAVRYYRYGRNHPGRGLIVTQYAPPKDTPLLTSAVVKHVTSKIVAAQIIELALRDRLKIIDHTAEGSKGEFSIEISDLTGLYDSERVFLERLMVDVRQGAQFRFVKKPDAAAQRRATSLRSFVALTIRPALGNELRHKPIELKKKYKRCT